MTLYPDPRQSRFSQSSRSKRSEHSVSPPTPGFAPSGQVDSSLTRVDLTVVRKIRCRFVQPIMMINVHEERLNEWTQYQCATPNLDWGSGQGLYTPPYLKKQDNMFVSRSLMMQPSIALEPAISHRPLC